ncbi:MAG: hypothetical protein ACW99G_23640 [Candidatus Thorarchaeota archaeon]
MSELEELRARVRELEFLIRLLELGAKREVFICDAENSELLVNVQAGDERIKELADGGFEITYELPAEGKGGTP